MIATARFGSIGQEFRGTHVIDTTVPAKTLRPSSRRHQLRRLVYDSVDHDVEVATTMDESETA